MAKKIPLFAAIFAILSTIFPANHVFADIKTSEYAAVSTGKKTVVINYNFGKSERKAEAVDAGSTGTRTSYGRSGELEDLGSGSFAVSVDVGSDGKVSNASVTRTGYNGSEAQNIFFNGSYLLKGEENRVSDGKQHKGGCPKEYPIAGPTQYTKPGDLSTAYNFCYSENTIERSFTKGYAQDENLVYIWLNTDKIGGETSGDDIAYHTIDGAGTCGIKINGSLDEFNDSAKKCAEMLDTWRGQLKNTQNPYYEFGKVSFANTNGEVTAYNEENKSADEVTAAAEAAAAEENNSSSDGASGEVCYDNAGVLGWILCPAISTAAHFTENFYNDWLKPQLEIDANALFSDSGDTQKAWSAFRDIANAAFVILFLVVILSQLTGFGIDNYGIKRMLPRLIIAAILVNLSFFICQLAVDVANIAGIGVSKLIPEISAQIDDASEVLSRYPDAGQYAFTFLAGAIGVGTLLALGPGIVISVLFAALSVLVSVFFLFAILVARQSVVVILIVISPLALVCYLLPNTESLFKKWLKVFEAVLLLYPICSLVISAGGLAGGILAGAGKNNEGMRFAAMLVQVVPYFAIPALIKNSMAGIGNLGNRISGLGKTFNKNTVGRLSESDMAKTAKTAMNNFDPGGLRNRLAAKTGIGRRRRLQQITADNQRRGEALSLESALQKNKQLRDKNYQKAQKRSLLDKEEADDVDTMQGLYAVDPEYEDIDKVQKKLTSALNSGDPDTVQIKALQNLLSTKGKNGRKAIRESYIEAEKNGTISDKARQAFASNLVTGKASKTMAEHMPSMTEWAKKNQDSKKGKSIAEADNDVLDSLTGAQLASMDKEEFDRLSRSGDSRFMSAVQSAAKDDTLLANVAEGDRADVIRSIAAAENMSNTPIAKQDSSTSTQGETFEVHDNNQSTSTPTPFPAQTAESSDRISESIDSEHKEQFNNIMRREPGNRTSIAKQDSSTSTRSETLEARSTDQSTSTPTPFPAQTAESSDRISESTDSEHKEQFDNNMRREPGSRTSIAKQDSSTSTRGETLEVRNTDQSTSAPAPTPAPRQTTSSTAGRKAPTPDWVEREANNATQTSTGLYRTGGNSRAGLNLPHNSNQNNS